jgi:[ribosomal protein S5]-alanine N-acetyltransferase
MKFTPLQTERLILRPYSPQDAAALLPLIGAREVAATTLRIPHPYTEEHVREFLAKAQADLASGDVLRVAIMLSESGTLCGGSGLMIERDHNRAELGYWIGVPYWGKGYATEATRALVRYGFENLKLNRIYASYMVVNAASGNVLRKLGMKYEGRQRAHMVKWGEVHDLEMYGMLASDADAL